jgi:hypothetical protein
MMIKPDGTKTAMRGDLEAKTEEKSKRFGSARLS